jgi:hypothetical protein
MFDKKILYKKQSFALNNSVSVNEVSKPFIPSKLGKRVSQNKKTYILILKNLYTVGKLISQNENLYQEVKI